MKTITLPLDDLIKYDQNDNTGISCPVCDNMTFSVIFNKNGVTTIFCNNDEFYITRYADLTLKAKYTVFNNKSDDYMKKQNQELKRLFNDDLISGNILLETLYHPDVKIQKVPEKVDICEAEDCEEPQVGFIETYNGFELIGSGVCEYHQNQYEEVV